MCPAVHSRRRRALTLSEMEEFPGLLEKERRVVDMDEPNKETGQKGDRKQGWVSR